MTEISRILFQVARWIAGPERKQWVEAMEAEALSLGNDSPTWAMGCAIASLRDRIWRDRWILIAIFVLPAAEFMLRPLLFFPTIRAANALGLPDWTFIAVYIALAVPFAFVLGRFNSLKSAIIASVICGVLVEFAGVLEFWIYFGKGPEIWFQPNSHIYNMTPILGWATGISFWVIGAVVGNLTRPKKSAKQ